MRSSVVHLIPIASLGQALGISLPPLIPAIPGVTEPLNQLAPPLPILQVPTPPLDSPPFTASNIKPKKIGYFWTGAGDKQHKGACLRALVRSL
jgi:selenium-binding protein 1